MTFCRSAAPISRPLAPRFLRILVQNAVASMSWTLPLRSGALVLSRIQM